MGIIPQKFLYLSNNELDISAWIHKIKKLYPTKMLDRIQSAAEFTLKFSKGLTLFYGQAYLEQGLEMAEILLELNLDQDAIAASIVVNTVQITQIPKETLQNHLGESVANITMNALKLNALNSIVSRNRNQIQIDRLRKTFLAMVSDIRVVIIKLAEQTCIMRGIKNINSDERFRIANETLEIFAPLANRLGIGQLKWELEDAAFHYTHPAIYKQIADFLAEKRVDREKRINDLIEKLHYSLSKNAIKATVTGRAKHIYSIYLKAKRKQLRYQDIYDYSAVRILAHSIEECYAALSIVHTLFEQIPSEFDDYISHPKPNGYRSIHTAIRDAQGNIFEIQIRTNEMHEKAEHGVAAHWVYKEDKPQQLIYNEKIALLRQLLSWHKDPTQQSPLDQSIQAVLKDRIYAFTPGGEIIDLPMGSTPLDFAYHIHTQLGHNCRGAKINGNIVPLTYHLQTGDQVEILTTSNGSPSRDWLDKNGRYLKTNRARSKVLDWFKQQEAAKYIEAGKNSLDRELARTNTSISYDKLVAHFNLKNEEALFAAIGHGHIKVSQIIQIFSPSKSDVDKIPVPFNLNKSTDFKNNAIQVVGMDDLLTRIARCCKPIPGDALIGYITQGRGISIHRQGCNNVKNRYSSNDRFVAVNWDDHQKTSYYVDLQIKGVGQDILKEITSLLTHLKIDLVSLNSIINKKNHTVLITLTIQIREKNQLSLLISDIKRLPEVISVHRGAEENF